MTRFVLTCLALSACAGGKKDTEPTTPAPAPAAPAPAPEPVAAPAPTQTPAELYAACRDRMEGVEADGECKADADCAPAGCGGEVCVPAAKKAEITTTCEEQACFKVVEACGCHEGKCTWTVMAELPPNLVPSAPNKMLPPTGTPAPAPAEPAPAPAPAPAPH